MRHFCFHSWTRNADGSNSTATTLKMFGSTHCATQVSKLSRFPFFLKDFHLRENVRLARQDASDAEVKEACQLAHIHSVMVNRPVGKQAARQW